MKQEKIKAVIKDELTKIAVLSEKVGQDFDKEVIHDFRVTVKTLRSFLRLLKLHAPQPRLRLTRKFKRLYNIAGTIRDTQLEHEKMVQSAVALPDYIHTLQYILRSQKKEWTKHYHKKILKKLEERLLALHYEKMHPAVIENFFSAKTAVIAKISDIASPSDDQVHRVRKEVKDIIYAARLIEKNWKGAKKKVKVLPAGELSSFATISGDYNDHRTRVAHILSFSVPGGGNATTDTIKKITVKEKASLDKEKNNVLSLVKGLVTALQKK